MTKIGQVISSAFNYLFVKPKNLFFTGSSDKTNLQIKAFLFDMDGLLVDTETICSSVVVDVLKSFGINITKLEGEQSCGITARKFYMDILEKKGLKRDIEAILQTHYKIYEEALKTRLKPFNGATILPRKLKQDGYKIGLVSGSTRKTIEFVLNTLGIRDCFDTIVSADDITNSKPNPEGYLKAANILGVNPDNCIVFEDSYNGTKAGKASGMTVVGVMNLGTQDISCADLQIKDLTEFDISKI